MALSRKLSGLLTTDANKSATFLLHNETYLSQFCALCLYLVSCSHAVEVPFFWSKHVCEMMDCLCVIFWQKQSRLVFCLQLDVFIILWNIMLMYDNRKSSEMCQECSLQYTLCSGIRFSWHTLCLTYWNISASKWSSANVVLASLVMSLAKVSFQSSIIFICWLKEGKYFSQVPENKSMLTHGINKVI